MWRLQISTRVLWFAWLAAVLLLPPGAPAQVPSPVDIPTSTPVDEPAPEADVPDPGRFVLPQVALLTAPDSTAGDSFGPWVNVSGDTIAVGAPLATIGDNDNQGAVYIFQRSSPEVDNWALVHKLTAPDGTADARFGRSFALAGDTLLVGARNTPCAVYVFRRDRDGPGAWGLEKKLLSPTTPGAEDCFGSPVALDQDTAAIGDTTNSIYLFDRNHEGPNAWGQAARVDVPDPDPYSDYGPGPIAISGDRLVAVMPCIPPCAAGAVYVFERNNGGPGCWGQAAILANGSPGTARIDGNTIVVLEAAYRIPGGTVVFEREPVEAGVWDPVPHKLDGPGRSVAIDRDTIVVGHPGGIIPAQWRLLVFTRDKDGSDTWESIAGIPNDAEFPTYTGFGVSVGISGNTIVVGHDQQHAVYVYRLLPACYGTYLPVAAYK